uniref:G_PROTEIN_RECEP_F1_2 domain-containing protein n=1 Tax=Meloidogyne hapla TaxID=6305 RepID=A0A1I8BC38_MELHA
MIEVYSSIIVYLEAIGLFSNLLLICLIIRYTMNEMKVYNRILLQTCIVDIILIFVFAVVQPVFVSDNGIGTVWEYGPTHYLPTPWQCICFMIFAFITRFTTMNVCSQFVFRYLTVVR